MYPYVTCTVRGLLLRTTLRGQPRGDLARLGRGALNELPLDLPLAGDAPRLSIPPALRRLPGPPLEVRSWSSPSPEGQLLIASEPPYHLSTDQPAFDRPRPSTRGTSPPQGKARPSRRRAPAASCARTGHIEQGALLVAQFDAADEPPSSDLELGTLARFHADVLIPEECAAARDHPSTRGDTQPDVSDQVENPKYGSICRRSAAKSIRTSPTTTTICSSDHPVGRAFSVTSPRRREHRGSR